MADFFGIDVGSSFIKGALIDPDSFCLRHTERVPFPEFEPGLPPLHREVDPGAILRAVEELIERLWRIASACDGVVLCGQMHGVILVDERGEAASNYISWLDQRVSPAEFDQIAERITPAERAELGHEFRSSIAASLLYWLARHRRLPSGPATPVSVADYVAGRLSGAMPVMEPTQAAAFGALRLGTLEWHREVIGKLGLDSLRWPEVRPTGGLAGSWRGAPCWASAGDAQCALAGALLADGELSLNIGTGCQISMTATTTVSDGHQVRPYFDGRYLRTITHIPGGRALGALVGLMTELGGASEEEAWRRIVPAVEAVPETSLRAGAAFFPGPCGHGGFLENLREENMSAGHVFRAVFKSMASNYAACAHRLDPNRSAARMVFSGGVARRLQVLRDLTAKTLELPHRLSPHPEDTMFGLMVLGAAYSGRRESVRAAAEAAAEAPQWHGAGEIG